MSPDDDKSTRELLLADIEARQTKRLDLGSLPWREILLALGLVGSNVTTGTVSRITAPSATADEVCVERINRQNAATHATLQRCMELIRGSSDAADQ